MLSYTAFLITIVDWYRALEVQGIDRKSLHWHAPFMLYAAFSAIGPGGVVNLFSGFNRKRCRVQRLGRGD